MLSEMGARTGDIITLPDGLKLTVHADFDMEVVWKKIIGQYVLQDILEENVPNMIYSGASCNGLVHWISAPAAAQTWAGIDMGRVMQIARQLRVQLGWCHTSAYADDAVVFDNQARVGFENQQDIYFNRPSPATWTGNDIAFLSYRHGQGHAAYTEACLLLAAARSNWEKAAGLPEWHNVFGDRADEVLRRTMSEEHWDDSVVCSVLRGVQINALK